MGTREQNKVYCLKENNILILHEESKILSKAEQHYLSLIKATPSETRTEIAQNFPKDFVVHNPVVEQTLADHQKVREAWPGTLNHKNFWIGGVAGPGKSRWAAGIVDVSRQYPKTATKWRDGDVQQLHRT
jgi:hypothetical protein